MDQLQGKWLWHTDRQDGGPSGAGGGGNGGGGLQALAGALVLFAPGKVV